MNISAEEKVCYLREAAIVLAKEGFQLDEVHTDRLCILLDGSPLCEVTESGGVAYRNEDIRPVPASVSIPWRIPMLPLFPVPRARWTSWMTSARST